MHIMRVLILRCGETAAKLDLPATLHHSAGVEIYDLPAVPGRGDLKFLSAQAQQLLPEDPTPSLDEIQAQPRVEHQAAPQLAPQKPALPLRIIVIGSDAALSAVLTRMMRADIMWPQVGFVPVLDDAFPAGASSAAQNWSIPTEPAAALKLALTGEVQPVPLIRNDAGQVVAGSATISHWDATPITGEIIVDDATLVQQDARAATNATDGAGEKSPRQPLEYGARLVPMLDAPGIAAVRAISPVEPLNSAGSAEAEAKAQAPSETSTPRRRGWLARWRKNKASTPPVGKLDPASLVTGRAVQAGGPELAVHVDGVRSPRPQKRVTFYRHLRDLQIIRP